MAANEEMTVLERRVSSVLHASLTHIDARTRSRLNRARQAAVATVPAGAHTPWRGLRFMPMTGAIAAAVLIALVMLGHRPQQVLLPADGPQASVEVLDMLADDEGLSLVEDEDQPFYEWAAAQGAQDGTGRDASAGATG